MLALFQKSKFLLLNVLITVLLFEKELYDVHKDYQNEMNF